MSDDVGVMLARSIAIDRIERHAALAPYTTFRVGGPADWLVHARGASDVRHAAATALVAGVPLTILGGGSNVLVADSGVRGIVVRLHGGDARAISPSVVRADAGMTMNGLVRWTMGRGLAGLEAWAGTPGTVGGAVRGNAHFKGRNIDTLVVSVEVLDRAGRISEVPAAAMEFAYDYSRIQRTQEIVLSADFAVGPGEPAALRAVARDSLAYRKRTQPLESATAGCVFQNPDAARDSIPAGIPPSAGALVDRAGLKGAREGNASVSLAHGNFVLNEGAASAEDVRRLIERCRTGVKDRFGVDLRDEIVYLGFD